MTTMSDFFELRARKTTVGREVRGAVATFLTMAYILFANPRSWRPRACRSRQRWRPPRRRRGLLHPDGTVRELSARAGERHGAQRHRRVQVAPAAGSWQTAMGLVVLDGLVVLLLVSLVCARP